MSTDTNQASEDELDDILTRHNAEPGEMTHSLKQAILDWHNKQVEELLDRAKHIAEPNLDEDPYHYQVRVQNAIEAERNKLKESHNG